MSSAPNENSNSMTSTPNENKSLMDDFEEAFQNCLLTLTKPEPSTGTQKEETTLEAQKAITRFIDVARQMEAFFLQKRLMVSTLKPDLQIKDENQDLRIEIQRKDALLNRHHTHLEEWKACLAEINQNSAAQMRPSGQMPSITEGAGGAGNAMAVRGSGQFGASVPGGGGMGTGPGPAGQHAAQFQQQQQKMMQAQQMQQMRMMKMQK